MKERVRVIGSYLSPYVRKVLVFLDLKGIPYEVDPIVPAFGDDGFTQISPLRRIPVLVDSHINLCDSSVICQYLEDRYPRPSLYPCDVVARAKARWIEEYADTRIGDVIIWRLFYQVAIGPGVFRSKTDRAIVDKAVHEEIPQILDHLEPHLPESGFMFGELSIADITLACFFRNAAFARVRIDATRWPRSAAFIERVLALPSFTALTVFEDRTLRAPVAQHRQVLAELGAPLTAETCADDTLRPRIMQT